MFNATIAIRSKPELLLDLKGGGGLEPGSDLMLALELVKRFYRVLGNTNSGQMGVSRIGSMF